MNVANFQKLKALILEEPNRFIMHAYHLSDADKNVCGVNWGVVLPDGQTRPPCGTVACLCGWANMLQDQEVGRTPGYMGDEKRAANWLGISTTCDRWSISRTSVFHEDFWPEPFKTKYRRAKDATERARVAADYIDWLCSQETPDSPPAFEPVSCF